MRRWSRYMQPLVGGLEPPLNSGSTGFGLGAQVHQIKELSSVQGRPMSRTGDRRRFSSAIRNFTRQALLQIWIKSIDRRSERHDHRGSWTSRSRAPASAGGRSDPAARADFLFKRSNSCLPYTQSPSNRRHHRPSVARRSCPRTRPQGARRRQEAAGYAVGRNANAGEIRLC
jgi:hypothetical protein